MRQASVLILAKSIQYTAFVLDNDSHQKLAELAPEGWKVYAHHMTMISTYGTKAVDTSFTILKGVLKL